MGDEPQRPNDDEQLLGIPLGEPSPISTGSTGLEDARYRSVLGHFASGVTVVSASAPDGPTGFTCQSFFSLSLEPMLIAFAVGRASKSWPKIAAVGRFCVNVLGDDQEALARSFATSGADKFSGVAWQPTTGGSPRLAGVLAWIECRTERLVTAGDHELVIGAVEEFGSSEGRPLVFYRGGFLSGLR